MQHLGIIPDGNRRWAKQNKLQTILGHQTGGSAVKAAIYACLEKNIRYLSIYTFSLENFNRSEIEKEYLFNLIPEECKKTLPELIEKKVRIKFIGDKDYFPKNVIPSLFELEEQTKNFDALIVNFLFCYGGKQEIIASIKDVITKVKNGELSIDNIDENVIKSSLWCGNIPDPDLIIRTGGVSRLSGFLTFQSAYSELIFLDYFWPEVTKDIIKGCIEKYDQIPRNFGR
ncbi:MAG: Tritrans,polycis-undecaprenyl-diphosphate synthase (geranylgeranyl-diphosphate specific) [candidate division TM6 bacterium GW2011_GWF2_37_49]|nr:MAG: Tritrans,polycis-undecaprenyl-diphosphate synthase (geranylgeranyl-diphosphate specific) [candidate division TM6 bacterium GW2011_GWF2_37_49]